MTRHRTGDQHHRSSRGRQAGPRRRLGGLQHADRADRQVTASASHPGRHRGALPVAAQRPAHPAGRRPDLPPSPAMAGGALSVTVTGYAVGPRPGPAHLGARRRWRPPAGTPTATAATPRSPAARGSAGRSRRSGLDWVDYYGAEAGRLRAGLPVDPQRQAIKGATASTYRLTVEGPGQEDPGQRVPAAPAASPPTTYARSDATRQGPDRQARLTAPEDRRQGQGRQARRGAHEGLDQRDEVPLPVVRRQEGDPRRDRQEAPDHPVDAGARSSSVKVTGHQEGLQEGQREVAGPRR